MKTGFLFLICCLFSKGSGQCSFPDTLVASWKSSNYGTITITSSTLTLGEHTFNLNGQSSNTVYDIHACNTGTNTYVVKSQITFSSHGETGNAYVCFVFTQVTTNSYYFYMNSVTDSIFNNERLNFWATTESPMLQVCNGVSGDPSTAEFNSMLRLDSSGSISSDITTNCVTPLLGNFSYVLTSVSGTETTCAESILNTCYGRQTITLDYTTCTMQALYTAGGQLGCISNVQDGSTYYAGLYNYDASPDSLTTFEFICIAVTSDGDVTLTANPKRCVASQTPTTASLQKLVLTAYFTCPFTEDSVNVLAIVLGVLFGLLFLALLALLIYCICKKKKKKDRIKAKEARNLKVFEKKMAMDEFDDEHPLNEASLVPDFPQNGYPQPLKIAPRGKKYTMPQVIDAEIQTERSSITDMEFGQMSNRGFGYKKDFHNSNRSLTTQRDYETQTDRSTDRSFVSSHNKVLKNKIPGEKLVPEFPSEPQFLPWPWRTANRAMNTNTTSVKSGAPSYKSNMNGLPDLGEFMIKNYNIKYDDTLSSGNTHPPPRRRLSRSQSIHDLSRPPTRMLEMKKTHSQEQLNRSKTSIGEYPTPRTILSRAVSHNDISQSGHNYNHFQHNKNFWNTNPTMPHAPSRRASMASIKSVMQRSNTRMLKTIRESRERIPTPLKSKKKPPLPAYMRPLTRSKTVPPPSALKMAKNVYGTRPSTGKLKQNTRSLLQTKLKQKNMERPVRKKKKVLRKKRSSWKSPFALPSSFPPRPISLRSLSKMKHAKVEPARSYRTSTRLKDSISSRDFATTDDVTSDSTGENFMDSEIPKLPKVVTKPKVAVVSPPKREKTYRMDKKRIVSEDSGISADDSASSKDDDDTRFPLPDIIETSNSMAPGQLKPPPRRQNKPWK